MGDTSVLCFRYFRSERQVGDGGVEVHLRRRGDLHQLEGRPPQGEAHAAQEELRGGQEALQMAEQALR